MTNPTPLPCHPDKVSDNILAALRLIIFHGRDIPEASWLTGLSISEIMAWRLHGSVLLRHRPDMDDAMMWSVVASARPSGDRGMYEPAVEDPTWSVPTAERWLYAVERGCDLTEACRFAGVKKPIVVRWVELGEHEGAHEPFISFARRANEAMVKRVVKADTVVLDVMANGSRDGDRLKAAELVKTWANPDRYGRRSNVEQKVTVDAHLTQTRVSVLADLSVEDVGKLLAASEERRRIGAAAPIDASNIIDVLSGGGSGEGT